MNTEIYTFAYGHTHDNGKNALKQKLKFVAIQI